MKKVFIIICLLSVCCLTACTGNSPADIEKSDNAYEAMSSAVESGDYQEAMEHYNNGAADSGNENLVSLYYQAIALQNFAEKGCLGHPVDLLTEKSTVMSDNTESVINQLRSLTEMFDGVYQNGSYFYVYFSDGKIAGGEGGQLFGETYCTGELVLVDGTYYWATHSDSESDTLLYTVEKTDSGIKLIAVDSSNNIFEGEYQAFVSDMPQLKY